MNEDASIASKELDCISIYVDGVQCFLPVTEHNVVVTDAMAAELAATVVATHGTDFGITYKGAGRVSVRDGGTYRCQKTGLDRFIELEQESDSLRRHFSHYWNVASRLLDIARADTMEELEGAMGPYDPPVGDATLHEVKDCLVASCREWFDAPGYSNRDVWDFIKRSEHQRWLDAFEACPALLEW